MLQRKGKTQFFLIQAIFLSNYKTTVNKHEFVLSKLFNPITSTNRNITEMLDSTPNQMHLSTSGIGS